MSAPQNGSPKQLAITSLAALGVVYGDIGTSPLYAVRECFIGPHAMELEHDAVYGILSLIVWSLILVVTVKYMSYVLRADNQGEGGILALQALVIDPKRGIARQPVIYVLGLFGAALLYGDGMITPAISVLSAVEGVKVAVPWLSPIVIPATCLILLGLFWMQQKGTASVGALFGPIMTLWFITLIAIAIPHIVAHPAVLNALSPTYAVQFFFDHGFAGFAVLGSVVLVVTGGESLYADLGHFGAKPIRICWIFIVLPALLINYFGQAAFLLENSDGLEHPIMHMSPEWAHIPVLALSTVAAVIASQALISGVFSITRQAILLGYAPRLRIMHTSDEQIGQIYLPMVNWTVMIGAIAIVIGFGSSSALAAAYGIAVCATMVTTTLLAHVVAVRKWRWPLLAATVITAGFIAMDGAFLAANTLKFLDGGWVPIAIAVVIFVGFTTWRKGRAILADRIRERSIRFVDLAAWIRDHEPVTVPGTAVYLTAHPDSVPLSLVDNVRHNHALHERVVLLSIKFETVARQPIGKRLRVERIDDRIVRLFGHYGFVETPNVPKLLDLALIEGLEIDMATVTFVMGRETLIATDRPGMAKWRESLFAFMSRNAGRAAAFFGIPSERVLEVGAQIEL
jgi:KUP system potassium uptake protein